MAIVKRKNPKTGKPYYFNTVTKKFASEKDFKGTSSVGRQLVKTKSGNKLTTPACKTASRELRTLKTSSAGKALRRCR